MNLYVVLFCKEICSCRLIGCSEKTELEVTLTTLEEDDGCEPKQMRSSLTGFHTPSLKSSKQSCAIISCRKCQFIHSLVYLFISFIVAMLPEPIDRRSAKAGPAEVRRPPWFKWAAGGAEHLNEVKRGSSISVASRRSTTQTKTWGGGNGNFLDCQLDHLPQETLLPGALSHSTPLVEVLVDVLALGQKQQTKGFRFK